MTCTKSSHISVSESIFRAVWHLERVHPYFTTEHVLPTLWQAQNLPPPHPFLSPRPFLLLCPSFLKAWEGVRRWRRRRGDEGEEEEGKEEEGQAQIGRRHLMQRAWAAHRMFQPLPTPSHADLSPSSYTLSSSSFFHRSSFSFPPSFWSDPPPRTTRDTSASPLNYLATSLGHHRATLMGYLCVTTQHHQTTSHTSTSPPNYLGISLGNYRAPLAGYLCVTTQLSARRNF